MTQESAISFVESAIIAIANQLQYLCGSGIRYGSTPEPSKVVLRSQVMVILGDPNVCSPNCAE